MNINIGLQNCPFCGTDETFIDVYNEPNNSYVKCEQCYAKGPISLDVLAAIVGWNNRKWFDQEVNGAHEPILERCTYCNGDGYTYDVIDSTHDSHYRKEVCNKCNGSGKIIDYGF